MATIYPLAMDLTTDYVVSTNTTLNTPYISISYAQYEDLDLVNETWSNKYNYSYWFPLASFSYSYVNDTETGEVTHLSFSGPGVQVQFSAGQIVDLSGDPISLLNMLGEITSALGI